MKINWKIRLKNPVFYWQIILSIFTPILAYFGLNGMDITSWTKLIEILGQAVMNPYVCVLVVISLWNTLNDPTTKGLSDSEKALTYEKLG